MSRLVSSLAARKSLIESWVSLFPPLFVVHSPGILLFGVTSSAITHEAYGNTEHGDAHYSYHYGDHGNTSLHSRILILIAAVMWSIFPHTTF